MFKQIKEFPAYSINKAGVILKKDGSAALPAKDGYTFLIGENGYRARRLALKLSMVTFPELLVGVEIDEFPLYRITDDGKIFSLRNCRFASLVKQRRNNSNKYDITIKLYLEDGSGKAYARLVHRLVAKAYIPNPFDLPEVNHIDGNPSNNNVNNLEWVSKVNNTKHAVENYLFKGQQKKVLCYTNICDEPIRFISMQQAADTLGMKSKNANKNISECCTKNASDRTNRGESNKTNPFRTEGYAFKYDIISA